MLEINSICASVSAEESIRGILRQKLSRWLDEDKWTVTIQMSDLMDHYDRVDKRLKVSKFVKKVIRKCILLAGNTGCANNNITVFISVIKE